MAGLPGTCGTHYRECRKTRAAYHTKRIVLLCWDCAMFLGDLYRASRVLHPPSTKYRVRARLRHFGPLGEEECAAVASLTEVLISAPVIPLPKTKGHYTIHTDGCDNQSRGVLFQEQEDGRNNPVRYRFRTLNDGERQLTRM